MSRDGEHFLSSDDLNVNVWNMHRSDAVYNVVNKSKPDVEQLEEVILHSEFHPINPYMFLYCNSKSNFSVCDFRDHSTFDSGQINF